MTEDELRFQVGAVILAAGLSRRMGQPKMILPWGNTTIIGQVVKTLDKVGVDELLVITGGTRELVEMEISGTRAVSVFNPKYDNGEMLSSIQTGLFALSNNIGAALIALGDQPQMKGEIVHKVIQTGLETKALLVVPSYEMRRGHPWLIRRELWQEVLALKPPETLRDFLRLHEKEIHYLIVDSQTILQDLDTPQDYDRSSPKGSDAGV